MRLLCINNDLVDERAKTTLNTILDHLGFFYTWINIAEQIGKTDLVLEYATPNSIPGITKPRHLYIPASIQPAQLNQQVHNWKYFDESSQATPLISGSMLASSQSTTFSFDLIANVYYHLNRIEEQEYTHPDLLPVDDSANILSSDRPVVDELVDFFETWLKERAKEFQLVLIQKTTFPKGESFGLSLTHDVDFINAFHPLKKWYLKTVQFVKGNPGGLKAIEDQDCSRWGFPALLELYQKRNWTATFFFIARYLEGTHFRYRINSRKMRKIIRQLVDAGHEIALHPSRFAFEHPTRYHKEKSSLESVSHLPIQGMRQHYLRGLFPGLWKQASKLGLTYETSLSHRRTSGFRSGTCRPYFAAEVDSPVLAIPTLFFENTLPDEGEDEQESLKKIKQILTSVKKHQGLFNLIWHTNHILQPENYKNIWLGILELLSTEQPFVATLSRHSDWIKQRQEIHLSHVKMENEQITMDVSFPSEISQFSLYLPYGQFNIDTELSGFSFTQNQNLLTINNTENQSSCIIRVTGQ